MCFRGTAQVQQCLNQRRPPRRKKCSQQLQVELAIYLEHNQPATKPVPPRSTAAALSAVSGGPVLPVPTATSATGEPSLLPHRSPGPAVGLAPPHGAPCFLTQRAAVPSLLLHIPRIFTCVKGKQLCHIFSLTS